MCSIEDEEEVEQTMVDDKKSCADDKEEEDEVKVLYFRPQGQAPSVTSSRGNMETVISLPGLTRDQDAGGVEIETTRAMIVPNQVPSQVERAAKVLTKRPIATICEHQNAPDARMLAACLEGVLGVGRQATI